MVDLHFVSVPFSMELCLVSHILDKWLNETYSVCSGHRRHSYNNSSNAFPCIKMDIRDKLWDVESPDDANYDLEYRLHDSFFESLEEDSENWLRSEKGFEVFTDINGYRILADIPLVSRFYERLELDEEFKELEVRLDELNSTNDEFDWKGHPIKECIEDVKEEMKDIQEEIEGIDEDLASYANQLEYFEKYVEGLSHWFDDYVWIVKEEEDERVYDFVYKDNLDWLEAEGWKLWSKEEAEVLN